MAASEIVDSTASDVVSSAPSVSTVVASDVGVGGSAEIVACLELGFAAVVLGIGLIAGFILSKIVNWWKW